MVTPRRVWYGAVSQWRRATSLRIRGAGVDWCLGHRATGVALLVLFQNLFLVDSVCLFVFALIGIADRRENRRTLAAVVVLGPGQAGTAGLVTVGPPDTTTNSGCVAAATLSLIAQSVFWPR